MEACCKFHNRHGIVISDFLRCAAILVQSLLYACDIGRKCFCRGGVSFAEESAEVTVFHPQVKERRVYCACVFGKDRIALVALV